MTSFVQGAPRPWCPTLVETHLAGACPALIDSPVAEIQDVDTLLRALYRELRPVAATADEPVLARLGTLFRRAGRVHFVRLELRPDEPLVLG